MAYKYIYIDDSFDNLEKGTINGLEIGGEIEIDFLKPNTWEELLRILVEKIPNSQGLLLDLRLGEMPFEDEKRAQYKGSTLAQEIRTLIKEKKTIQKDIPIVLISGDTYIKESLDKTSHDLFDAIIEKEKLGNEIPFESLKQHLISLANGYLKLNETQAKIPQVLNIENLDYLDNRFVEIFTKIESEPKHVIARLIIKEVLEKPSFLIDEYTLASRLGVKLESANWQKFKDEILIKFKYLGVFSEFYERWWMPLINCWWESLGSSINLRSATAQQRVDLLNEKFKTALEAETKAEKSRSASFWTVCIARKIAIDTIDGFVIAFQDHLYPWQEKKYICIDEALRPSKIDLWKGITSIDKSRLSKLKDIYEKQDQRVKK